MKWRLTDTLLIDVQKCTERNNPTLIKDRAQIRIKKVKLEQKYSKSYKWKQQQLEFQKETDNQI